MEDIVLYYLLTDFIRVVFDKGLHRGAQLLLDMVDGDRGVVLRQSGLGPKGFLLLDLRLLLLSLGALLLFHPLSEIYFVPLNGSFRQYGELSEPELDLKRVFLKLVKFELKFFPSQFGLLFFPQQPETLTLIVSDFNIEGQVALPLQNHKEISFVWELGNWDFLL